jgi:hypothetical protein
MKKIFGLLMATALFCGVAEARPCHQMENKCLNKCARHHPYSERRRIACDQVCVDNNRMCQHDHRGPVLVEPYRESHPYYGYEPRHRHFGWGY